MRSCVRCATLNGYVALAKSLHLDPARLLTRVGINPADLAVPDKWIPAAQVAELLDLTARAAGVEDFALRLAERRRLSTLGPLSMVLREEPDLRSVLDLLIRYERTYNEALHMQLAERDALATVRLWLEFGEPAPASQALELATAALCGIIRAYRGDDWHPVAVGFSHPRPFDPQPYQDMFKCRVQFGHEFTGLVFYAADLDAANPRADPAARQYAHQFLDNLPAPRAGTSVARVREMVELLLPLGRCSMEQIARSMGVDVRTLRRYLAQEDESFSGIVHRTRAGMAERYLPNERYSLTDISELLGFAAPSAFTRWFRQQFQTSPTDWRERAAVRIG
jgi:AraC-like DNA-binding protein